MNPKKRHKGGAYLKKIIAFIIITVILIANSNTIHASPQNHVWVDFAGIWQIDADSNEIESGEYTAIKYFRFGFHNSPDDSREMVKEIRLIFRPAEGVKIEDADAYPNLKFQSTDPYIIVCKNLEEFDGCGMNFRTNIEEKIKLPFSIKREADFTYFETVGTQIMTIRLIPESSFVGADVGIEARSTPDADVEVLSTSMKYNPEVRENRVDFHLDNLQAGKEYIFKVELQITPKKGKVSFLPQFNVNIYEASKRADDITPKSVSVKTKFGASEAISSEELAFDAAKRGGFSVNFRQISMPTKILVERPTVAPEPVVEPLEATPAPTGEPTRVTQPPTLAPREEVVDGDGDGWSDELEKRIGTNPFNKDTDGDGVIDSEDPNPLKFGAERGVDSDGDGWSDELEKKAGTNPFNKDTDGDGLWDSKDPNPLAPEGEKKEIDWEQVGVVLVVMGAGVGWFLSRRKRSRVKKLLDNIDETYASFKMNARRCEAELYRHRDIALDHLKRGKIDDQSYAILDKRIDDYLGEIRERIMEERFGEVPARLKDEVRRMLQDGEISEDEFEAFENILGKSKGIGRKEKSDLRELFGKWKEEDKISSYSVLDKYVDEYLRDIGKVKGTISGEELKVEIDKILEDRVVTQEEFEEFSEMLERSDLSEGEKERLKKKLKKIRDLTSGPKS
ncbi:MAG: hypothetical protein ACE5PM_00610 [Candidatus Hydrothermarchaeales archaeon]